jgi:hypothetical protein
LGVPILVSAACSSDDDPSTPPPPPDQDCLANGTVSSIDSNHGHLLVVSKADVDAETEKTYAIQGSSPHNHQVTISAAQFQQLKSNTSVSVTSGAGGGHSHSVMVSCA